MCCQGNAKRIIKLVIPSKAGIRIFFISFQIISGSITVRKMTCSSPSRMRRENHHNAPFLMLQSASWPESSRAARRPRAG